MRSFRYSSFFILVMVALNFFNGQSAPAQVKKAALKNNQAGIEFFENKIRPVLVKHCYECHSGEPDEESASFVLDTREGLLQGGDSGKSVVPGNLKQSLILQAIEHCPPALFKQILSACKSAAPIFIVGLPRAG
ncbi:MAG: hypothetical protein K0U82_22325, partial [Planctomycetes bacterium]|nr:hypothetical protein [Planctomycetota bacterium]